MGGGSPRIGKELKGHLVPTAARRIEELQHSLQKKDADLRAMEDRYRRYVDRACMVRMLVPHQPPTEAGPPIDSCLLPVCNSVPPAPTPAVPYHATDFYDTAYEAKFTLGVSSLTPRSCRPWNPSSGHLGGLPLNSIP